MVDCVNLSPNFVNNISTGIIVSASICLMPNLAKDKNRSKNRLDFASNRMCKLTSSFWVESVNPQYESSANKGRPIPTPSNATMIYIVVHAPQIMSTLYAMTLALLARRRGPQSLAGSLVASCTPRCGRTLIVSNCLEQRQYLWETS
jgi:hypothetical protein